MQFSMSKKTYKSRLAFYKNRDLIKFHQFLSGLLNLHKSDKVLDVGCGHGHTLMYITRQLGIHGRAVGLDIGEPLLAVAERVLRKEMSAGKLELIKGDASKRLPFPNASFEKIVSHNVIECVPDKIHFINECFRILKRGGLLVLSHDDFDTQIYNSSFPALSRELVHNYCDIKQKGMECADGMIGRKLHGLFRRSKFKKSVPQTYTITNTSFKPLEYGYDSAQFIAYIAKESGKIDPKDIQEWLADLKKKDRSGEYFYSLNTYLISAVK
ncbi:MAG TPA: hypothetical protein DCS63_10355 [Elusimicrobia bacterium]|nr:hypothetical protein [Elusimicrobiota bacterium]